MNAAAERNVTVVDTTNGSSYPVAEWALAMAMIRWIIDNERYTAEYLTLTSREAMA